MWTRELLPAWIQPSARPLNHLGLSPKHLASQGFAGRVHRGNQFFFPFTLPMMRTGPPVAVSKHSVPRFSPKAVAFAIASDAVQDCSPRPQSKTVAFVRCLKGLVRAK